MPGAAGPNADRLAPPAAPAQAPNNGQGWGNVLQYLSANKQQGLGMAQQGQRQVQGEEAKELGQEQAGRNAWTQQTQATLAPGQAATWTAAPSAQQAQVAGDVANFNGDAAQKQAWMQSQYGKKLGAAYTPGESALDAALMGQAGIKASPWNPLTSQLVGAPAAAAQSDLNAPIPPGLAAKEAGNGGFAYGETDATGRRRDKKGHNLDSGI